jgi:hypothetical protein
MRQGLAKPSVRDRARRAPFETCRNDRGDDLPVQGVHRNAGSASGVMDVDPGNMPVPVIATELDGGDLARAYGSCDGLSA